MAAAGFDLRRMEPSDLDAVLAIENASFARPWTPEAFQREFELPQSRRWVATRERAVVGCLIWWEAGGEFHVMDLVVAAGSRRQGVAGLLLDRMLEEASAHLATFIGLEVNSENSAARALYASRGFVEKGRRSDYYGPGEDALLLERDPGPPTDSGAA